MYRQNLQRAAARQSFGNYEDYLRSLEMRCELGPFDTPHAERITQLINKTNQFNLTTRRYTAAEYGRYWSKHYEERREPKKPSGPAKPPQHPQHPQQKPGPQAGRNPPKGPGHDNGRHEGRKNDGRRDNWDGPR